MIKKYSVLFIVLFAFLGCENSVKAPIRIATAANMQFAIEELMQQFEAETGIACEAVVSSSGKLTAQIKAGAPYDIFVSADMKYPQELFQQKFTDKAPESYAYGSLVMWTWKKKDSLTTDFLKSEEVTHIAVANPDLAPYGRAAMEFLKQEELTATLQDKIVFGQSISGVNQYITTKAAEVGFTAKSVVLSPEVQTIGTWISIPTETYTPIAQGAIILKQERTEKQQKQVEEFYAYLFSQEAQRILEEYGYLVE